MICRLENFNIETVEYHQLWTELDDCEHNCPYYYSCDKAGWMDDKLKELDGEE